LSLRILHISPYYLPDVKFGGPVFSVSALCEALVASGASVTVFTVAYGGHIPHVSVLNGVEVHYFKSNHGSPCQVSLTLWQELKKKAHSFDVAHVHTWWNILIFKSIGILHKQKVPVVLSPRGMMSDYTFTHRKTLLKHSYQQSAGNRLLRGVHLLATAPAEAEEMAKRTKRALESIAVVPNLLSLPDDASYHSPGEGFVLGFMSRLHHKKGIDLLLQAVAQCPQVTKLILAGRGEPDYENWMRGKIDGLGLSQKVEWAGWLSDADKPGFFQRIHVFVLPSYNENFANVVAEAWSHGKPVIVSSGVALHRLLDEYDVGWRCDATSESVATAIQESWQQRHLWPQKGNMALQLVREQLNGVQLVQAYLATYDAAMASNNKKMPVLPKKADTIYALGINAYHADASAAIYRDGKLVGAMEEERFKRLKHWAGFPAQSVAWCLSEAGIKLENVNYIAVGRDPNAKWARKVRFVANNPKGIPFAIRGRLSNATDIKSAAQELMVIPSKLSLNELEQRVNYIEHHRSHLASAFFASPYQQAALLSIDGSGDFTTTMMAVGQGNSIKVLNSIDFPHSLGIFYTTFTQLLGFPYYGDEYKMMGLASYGQPTLKQEVQKLVRLLPDGTFRLELDWFRSGAEGYIYYDDAKQPVVPNLFTQKMASAFGEPRQPDEPITQYHKNLAASVQAVAENTLFHMLRHLHYGTGLTTLCLAGGVAQNSVANGKITRHTPFKEVYIPPASHDAGLAMGAALYLQHQILRQPHRHHMQHAYVGSHFSENDIEKELKKAGLSYCRATDFEALCNLVAHALANGHVVGWFRGRAEFGPRALGNRSILADPRSPNAKQLINGKIKRRESFRPFAPAILKEHAHEYFEMDGNDAPFMEKVFVVIPEKRNLIPAVTHTDGSGRIQTVSLDNNQDFYKLIKAFYALTGIPLLLNTSFNENEPIVNTPAEAIDCFVRTSMDMLVLENIIVKRN
jgi:carbamoyltransferase